MKWASRIYGFFMLFAGVMHFKKARMFMRIVPAFLPFKKMIVWISGVVEILVGVLLILNRFMAFASKLLTWLLILVWPANIYMAMKKMPLKKGQKPKPVLLWARVLFQWPLIKWAEKMSVQNK
ncbi:hypothetical protein E2R51_02780 [Jeotgalibacillus sp. S-D1]|uniref:DoxX family protein n=1 Tax=Jeotgalibacillus sp. S-D1 TaxID=2552189 RepID=UPI00105A6D33|nr:hypothetical protein [Jeotgalibacillus sp. S-D1]TDL34660.1 hypothetical protein E2R51_02780 [Jeotgalibacillus sp. S-D1]